MTKEQRRLCQKWFWGLLVSAVAALIVAALMVVILVK